MAVTLDFNAAEIAQQLPVMIARIRGAAGAGLYQELLKIKSVSEDRTPVMFGALRGSHVIEIEDSGPGGVMEGRVSVGGPAAPYAVFVHENLNIQHPGPHHSTTTGARDRYCGGQAKFLESAHNDAANGMLERLAAAANAGNL